MAWNAEFMDTFAHYPVALAQNLGKWTSATGTAPVAMDIPEDGLKGLQGGFLSKTLAATTGRIIATRGSTTGNATVETILKCCTDANDHIVWLSVDETNGHVTMNFPDGSFITSTQVVITNGAYYNFELAFLYTGVHLVYEVYVDGVKLLDIGSTYSGTGGADTPNMTQLRTFQSLGSFPPLFARAWIACKRYSGSGGQWVANDLYGTVKRGLLYPSADGNAPAGEVGRNWKPDLLTGQFTPRINETIADSGTSLIFTDVNPMETLSPQNEATWFMSDSPSDVPNAGLVTDVPHVQVNNLASFSGTLGTVYWVIRLDSDTNLANDQHIGDPANPANAQALTASFRIYPLAFGRDPRSGDPWSKSNLDSLELGVYAYDVI